MTIDNVPPPIPDSLSVESELFLSGLMKKHHVSKKKTWVNYNRTLEGRAYVIDVDDPKAIPQDIIRQVFEHNKQAKGRPISVVSVAGWDQKEWLPHWITGILGIIFKPFRRIRLLGEFSSSFSLGPLSTANSADVVIRIKKKAHRMKVVERDGKKCFRFTPGVRVTDADKYLAKRGLALPPNMPTLHVASLVGAAANGSYGPGRDYGPMSTNIVEMKVISPSGEDLTLSADENPDLFYSMKDFHMGAGFHVYEMTLGNIEEKFQMRRKDIRCNGPSKLAETFKDNPMRNHEHFVAMYFPLELDKQKKHADRIRITTFDRVSKEESTKPSKKIKQDDFDRYIKYMLGEIGEPFIDTVTDCENLEPLMPAIIKAAGDSTFGKKDSNGQVGWSPDILHLFYSYTDIPIVDINWLIQVDSPEDAQTLLVDLLQLVEKRLKKNAKDAKHPLFNAFSRYLKGLHYSDGKEHGMAPTMVEKEGQSILSFELLTYLALTKDRSEFNELCDEVIAFLRKKGYKFHYHPGKFVPEGVAKISEVLDLSVQGNGYENFKNALIKLHGGEENLKYSPFLTPEKWKALFPDTPRVEEDETTQVEETVSV